MKPINLRLPRLVENDDRATLINDVLSAPKKLWAKSVVEVAHIPFNLEFVRTLQLEHKKGRVVRGFELIERSLASQSKGLQQVDQKTGEKRGQRISRLLIISNDGSDRYMRKLEQLILQHKDRVLAIVIDADSERLGHLFFGEGKSVKLLMLEHKESVAAALFSLLPKVVED